MEPRRVVCIPEIKAVSAKTRTVDAKISDGSIDRDGDIIEPMGWELDRFKQNPVVLADHRASVETIIGRAVSIASTPEGLFATTEFADNRIGKAAFDLVRSGFLKAWSVGFAPIMAHLIEKGRDCERCALEMKNHSGGRHPRMHSVKQELREYSAVAVGANHNALTLAAKSGLSESELSVLFDGSPTEALIADESTDRRPLHDYGEALKRYRVRRRLGDYLCRTSIR